jgi:hypothetical protein
MPPTWQYAQPPERHSGDGLISLARGFGNKAVSHVTIDGARGMTSPILLEGRVSLFTPFPPVDKFAEQNNPFDQKHL